MNGCELKFLSQSCKPKLKLDYFSEDGKPLLMQFFPPLYWKAIFFPVLDLLCGMGKLSVIFISKIEVLTFNLD